MVNFLKRKKKPCVLVYTKNSPAIVVNGGIDWEIGTDWGRIVGADNETLATLKTDIILAIVQEVGTEWNRS